MERTLFTRARLPGDGRLADILVQDGTVVQASFIPQDQGVSTETTGALVDLGGLLLLPSLVEHHAHLDKALTADQVVNRTGDLMGAITAWIEAEDDGRLEPEDMQRRAEVSLEQLLYAGVTKVRSHVNVGAGERGLENAKAVRHAARRYQGLIDVELVALVHNPVAGELGRDNRKALEAALELGVDLIGGCPHLEADSLGAIKQLLAVAESYGIGLDLHVDETLERTVLTVEILAQEMLASETTLEVSASHCVSLSMQGWERQVALARLIREANIRVVALPQTNLFLQGWEHPEATPRGITPIGVLSDEGVTVVAGGDNVQDPFNPLGRFDPLETAGLLVLASHIPAKAALESVSLRPISEVDPLGDLIGQPADFLAVEALSIREAIALAPATRTVIRRGRVVARSTRTRTRVPQD